MDRFSAYRRALRLTGALLFIAFTLASCSRYGSTRGQSTEFATFIKAYTGGIVSDKTTIRVELTSDAPDITPGEDARDGLLTFTPSIKGTARWAGPRTLEFLPEAGALKSGQAYTGHLRLDKIHKVSSKRFKQFHFSFLVAIKEAVLNVDGVTITAASPELAGVEGTIALTEELPLETVQKMLQYQYPADGAEVNVTAGSDPLHYHFEILGLHRSNEERTLSLSLKPLDTGFTTGGKREVPIPAQGAFRMVSAERIDASDPYIDIHFSEPLADMDDFSGMITLNGAGRYYVQVENARAKVYYEPDGEQPVQLAISDGLKAWDGTPLRTSVTREFSAAEEKPAVEIPVEGSILPNPKELILPFKAVNLKAVDIRVIQVYEENVLMFLQDNELDGSNSIRRSGRLVYKRCLRLDTDPSRNLHKWQDFSVDLSGLFKQEPGAIYRIRISFKQDYSIYGEKTEFKSGAPSDELVDISSEDITEVDEAAWDQPYPYYYDDFYDWEKWEWKDRDNPAKPTYYMVDERFPAINLVTSRLGVIAKYAGGEDIWISVNDILTTDPVFNAELYVYSYQLKEIGYAKTGTDGMAKIHLSGKPFAVVAKRSGSTSYLKVTEGNEKSLSRFDVGGKVVEKGLKSFIYGERGVWRPGDTLHVTMILEDREGRIPDSHPATMEVYTPGGQFYAKQICNNAKGGFYAFELPTKPDDPTGIWHAYLKVGGASFHKALRIESIKPNRLKIALGLGEGPVEGGRKSPVEITSHWLTGPAAAGLRTTVDMTLRTAGTAFPGFEGYRFSNPLSKFAAEEYSIVDTRLDAAGHVRTEVNMPAADDAPGMLSADFVCSVEEPGGDVSFSAVTVPYSPFRAYVGIKVPVEGDSPWLETDKDYHIDIVAVDKDGKRLSGEHLSYAIFKLKWSWWWESRAEDLDSYVNSPSAERLATGSLLSGAKDCSIPLRVDYPEWGRYLVLVRDEDSGHLAGEILYMDWPAYRGRSSKSDPNALTMLSFATDKDTYTVGETAQVYIPATSKGQALVSLENAGGVISRAFVKTSGEEDAVYRFKVTEEMAPNFYIHITLLQPHGQAQNDLPIRLYGVKPILVNNPDSHLVPEIQMPDVIRPEETFSVKVREKNGKPMTYTLAIVDEGLLDLTAFKTPDPWKSLYEREALGVRTWDLYDNVIGAYSGRFSPMFSIGGDASPLNASKRDNRFRSVVQFAGPFTLGGGSATHKFKLPLYVGSVRVMVVAGRDGAYGNAEKTVPVRSPLLVLPTLPRVLGTGENVTMPVNVFALEKGVDKVTVEVKTEGPVRLAGDGKQGISFSEPGDQLVSFALEAEGSGEATVTVTARSGAHTAHDVIHIQVRNPHPAVLSVSRKAIGKDERHKFAFTPAEDGESWARLELATFPGFDCAGVYAYFKEYGYDCTEQLAAKGISLLSIRSMLGGAEQQEAEQTLPQLLSTLYARQRPDGGFALWAGQTDANAWVSSMAGEFLLKASKSGFPVSKGVLASWSRFQKKKVQEYRNTDTATDADLEQAYRLYTLALASEPENGAMNRLKESERLSGPAAWMLASAYAVAGKKSAAREIIASATAKREESQPGISFGSPLRDRAVALEALSLTDDLGEAMSVAEEVARAFSAGHYTTQEAAFASKAMAVLAGIAGNGALNAEVEQGGNTQQIRSAKSTSAVNLDAEDGQVSVHNLSDGIVYATLVTSGKAKAGQRTEASASGLTLSVKYLGENGKPLDPASLAQGTEFSMTVTVGNASAAREVRSLALTAAVPSGWEIYNDRLLGGTAGDDPVTYRDIRDDRIIWYFDLDKGASKTFRAKLRAAYEGEYILPSVRCEAMYDAKTSANTASGTARVVR